jgi:4,5-DOPA dioxygenase extradiol
MTNKLPTLFLSHGAPTLLIDPRLPAARIAALRPRLPRPKAILIASAHWLTDIPAVSTATQPETIHDFYGFPQALYEMTYPASGAPDLAARAIGLLRAAGLPAGGAEYGLDHGAWIPLKLLYPDADVPVAQLSIQPEADPAHHFRVGQTLAPLRDEGVLIVGSGQFTHNLRDLDRSVAPGQIAGWAKDFVDWTTARVAGRDWPALLDYRRQAPNAARAHPTDEHFLPLFVALGAAAEPAAIEHLPLGVTSGALAWDSYLLH